MGADALIRYPFSAVVGQERLKLALILSAIAPGIGGVLVRGEKGTAKTTVVRGLGPLLPATGERPRVVELPIGATEDRVIGSLDLTRVLRDGEAVFTPGLLAQADGGVLYIDEVNLLADHLVDVLLDAAASGRVTIERDGVSHTQDASFVLVGTMNPEEGELRPQLLDRFGLAVDVAAPTDVEQRVAVVERRMAFDADPAGFVAGFADEEQLLAERIAAARDRVNGILLPAAQLRRIAGICAHLQVDGLRGDLVVARAAAAHAAWRGAEEVDEDDIAVAVELALPHRRRRDPFDNGSLDDEALSDAMAAGDEAAGEPDPEPDPDGGPGSGASADRDTSDDGGFDGGAPDSTGTPATDDSQAGVDARRFGTDSTSKPAPVRPNLMTVAGIGDGDPGRRSRSRTSRGHTTRAVDYSPGAPVHLFGTTLAAAQRLVGGTAGAWGATGRSPVRIDDLRGAQREGTEGNLVVFVLDLSGSMTARTRLRALTEACVALLRDSYTRRDRVAVVVARGSEARVVVPPTRSVDLAVARLADLRVGGRTPLAEGLLEAHALIARARIAEPRRRPLLAVLTDGRATAGPGAVGRANAAARLVRRDGVDSVVIDCEQGMIRLGLAAELAHTLGGRHVPMAELTGARIASAVGVPAARVA
ncbi:MAG TPA: VWA domain-containing protein [Gordonia sp. (in: high G+C Gram-positive bacteria)]|uniref:VWA domain-containing protein n=1 Tax=unclassified Gordonia (in: high G+C Gram-positive bacteria) TaxID=2657482 RepID=UPI000FAC9688|nr:MULTISPECIES: VWA domain-containing protein [unclassified Gordonia (in: high G+C Gram-positive bacteria)]RTL08890.1 MAG: VWA domain-containing protein [Acidimicrobiia bacterium]HNP58772.1 VWA domain-containing protein [Gordonia sp. (in: high G+C Gram-positive bacteria)]HRC52512.1 VWA domain-containing protein [Gordonia sp. (in: high G+C Gram-positive bacteria)]